MKIGQVHYFPALGETFNFTLATENWNVSRVTLPRAGCKLDEELGDAVRVDHEPCRHQSGPAALAVAYNEVTQIISIESAPTTCSMPDKRALLL